MDFSAIPRLTASCTHESEMFISRPMIKLKLGPESAKLNSRQYLKLSKSAKLSSVKLSVSTVL